MVSLVIFCYFKPNLSIVGAFALGITPDQLSESTRLGPRAMQYLQGIDAWLTEQDPRLVFGLVSD